MTTDPQQLSDLQQHIQQTPLCDTHEHLDDEAAYTGNPPDILRNLFHNYVPADLVVAGADPTAVDALLNGEIPDIAARFSAVQDAWEAVRYTGYGEAVRTIAKEFYGLDELTPNNLADAQEQSPAFGQPGQRLQLLRNVANLDHVQIDNFRMECPVDESGPDFFFYDISWVSFCNGDLNTATIGQETGIDVTDLASLESAMDLLFEQQASTAIAVKSQHAYSRTLRWQERSDAEAEAALHTILRNPDGADEAARLCLGDWCWARGVELCIQHDLPFKIHTGYYAGHSRMPVDRIRSGHLCPLLAAYPDARFVLMHIAYPYSNELIALAKHYPNVYVDLCWAWSIDPFSTQEFVRRYLHAVPANKLFAFGGDTHLPVAVVAYARQARHGLTEALQAEIDDGSLSEAEAIALATRWMRDNQYDCFRVEEKKRTCLAQSDINKS